MLNGRASSRQFCPRIHIPDRLWTRFFTGLSSQYSEGVNALSTVWTERLQSSCRDARFAMRFCACSWTHLRIWPRSNSRAHPMSG